jgi:hypothetical protein
MAKCSKSPWKWPPGSNRRVGTVSGLTGGRAVSRVGTPRSQRLTLWASILPFRVRRWYLLLIPLGTASVSRSLRTECTRPSRTAGYRELGVEGDLPSHRVSARPAGWQPLLGPRSPASRDEGCTVDLGHSPAMAYRAEPATSAPRDTPDLHIEGLRCAASGAEQSREITPALRSRPSGGSGAPLDW